MSGDDIPLSDGAVPVRDEDFVLEELDGELLLFNPQNGRLLELNSTAALVWQLCDGARSVTGIRRLLGDAYPQSAQAIQEDLPRILLDLSNLGVITWQ